MGKGLENAKALYMEGIRDGNAAEAIEKYVGSRYTQHSTPVKDGKEGFLEFFNDFIGRNPIREIEIVRGFQDGRYVFVQAFQKLNNGEFKYVTADMFDTDEEGKIVEHWDCIAEVVEPTVSGHSQIDGPTELADLDKTEENKALVTSFLNDVLKNGQVEKITEFISTETYIQHNVGIGDGLGGFNMALAEMAEKGLTMVYNEIHKVIGCGNFVATLSAMNMAGTDMCTMDLFRVADGKIVEHWDVMEPIMPKETWVNSGKF